MRNVLLEMGSEEQADSLNDEEVSIFHYYRNCRSERKGGWGEEGVGKISYQLLQMCQRKNY